MDTLLLGLLDRAGLDSQITHLEPTSQGAVNTTWLIDLADGQQLVIKCTPGVAPDLFEKEAEGLQVLRTAGGLHTPEVLYQDATGLILERFQPAPEDLARFWEQAAQHVAALHRVTHTHFGWHGDGYLGLLPQTNRWDSNGHVFFAEQRVLRYLSEPRAGAVLTEQDRRALERLCQALPDLIPEMPPTLTHGDLHRGNLLATPQGQPGFIDPAVSWMWPEVDLSMLYCCGAGRPPARFFEVYQELRGLDTAWRERMPILHLREWLSVLAHEGDVWGALQAIRQVIAPFRQMTTHR